MKAKYFSLVFIGFLATTILMKNQLNYEWQIIPLALLTSISLILLLHKIVTKEIL